MSERRHFIAVVVLIGVLTVLFQFSAVVKRTSLDYASNHAAESAGDALKITQSEVFDPMKPTPLPGIAGQRRLVAFVGAKSSPYREAALDFATFAKWSYVESATLAALKVSQAQSEAPGLCVVDPAAVSWPDGIARLQEMQRVGFAVVLCSLPDESLIEANDKLRAFLGIAKVRQPSVELTGFHLFEGLLLGGAKEYRNTPEEEHLLDGMDLDAPWYVMAGGSKVYLRGEVDTDDYPDAYAHDEIIPPLMWRFSEGFAPLFVAYGPVLARPEGFGLLTAFVAETTPYEVWPVANAQVLALNDYPVLAKENDEAMQRIYARDSISVQRDVVWGSLSSLANQTGAVPTFLLAPELEEGGTQSPDPDLLRFYLRSIDELKGEMGLACDAANDAPLLQKVKEDAAFLHAEASDYTVSVAGVRSEAEYETMQGAESPLKGVRTIITLPQTKEAAREEAVVQQPASPQEPANPQEPARQTAAIEAKAENRRLSVVGYLNNDVMRLSTTSNCWTYTALDDLVLRACETGLGYSCVTFDLKGLTHPANKNEEWQEGYRKMLANYQTYWQPFRSLRQVPATTCDAYIRKTLAADFSSVREGDKITVECVAVGSAEGQCFFLRLHDEHVVRVTGGSYTSLENGFYVIRLDDARAVVEVASDMQPTVVR